MTFTSGKLNYTVMTWPFGHGMYHVTNVAELLHGMHTVILSATREDTDAPGFWHATVSNTKGPDTEKY